MYLKQARPLAESIVDRLKDFTDIIHIAGSIRREKSEVKDIEIVCIPHYLPGGQVDMFSSTATDKVISQNYVAAVSKLGKVVKGKPDGRYMQIELPQRINLDLFMPDPVDYWRQFVIRTGSADYVRSTITKAWLKKGWCGSDKGLRRIEDCEAVYTPVAVGPPKRSWKCINPQAELPPVWSSESDFLKWVGVDWIMPKMRII